MLNGSEVPAEFSLSLQCNLGGAGMEKPNFLTLLISHLSALLELGLLDK